MKRLFTICFCFLSIIAFTQITEEFIIKNKLDAINEKEKSQPLVNLLKHNVKKEIASQYSFKNIAPGIHILPLDRMPCIVPDTKNIVAIPNAAIVQIPFITTMPNVSPPITEK